MEELIQAIKSAKNVIGISYSVKDDQWRIYYAGAKSGEYVKTGDLISFINDDVPF